jgi:hypothetical protein
MMSKIGTHAHVQHFGPHCEPHIVQSMCTSRNKNSHKAPERMGVHMMHMAAHQALSVRGAMAVHMHIPPIGDVQYVQHPEQIGLCAGKSDLSLLRADKGSVLAQTVVARVGGSAAPRLPGGAHQSMDAAVAQACLVNDRRQGEPLVAQRADFDGSGCRGCGSADCLTGSGAVALSMTHASGYPLTDSVRLEFSNGREDVCHEPPGAGAQVNTILEADKGHARLIEILDAAHEVRGASAPSVELPDHDGIDVPSLGLCDQALSSRAQFAAADLLLDHGHDFPAASLGHTPQFVGLHGSGLPAGRDAAVQGNSANFTFRRHIQNPPIHFSNLAAQLVDSVSPKVRRNSISNLMVLDRGTYAK